MSHTAKSRFLDTFQRENATTKKVLDHFPAAKADLKPHDRSNSAMALAWTFAIEQGLMIKGLKQQDLFAGGFPQSPGTWDAVIAAFDNSTNEVLTLLRDASNADLDGTVKFFSGPKQMADFPLEQFLWFMLHDQIHHRGQMSVYLRLAGAKVPSIYGPSADEPWM